MKALRWVGYIIGGLVALIVVLLVVVVVLSNNKLGTGYALTPDAVEIPTDEAALVRGERFVQGVSACAGCHGEDLSGKMFIDEPGFASIAAPNLTSGQGGVGGAYTDADWIAAIRHGVAADGRAMYFMPSHWYYYLTDEDLGEMVAYLKSVPPVDQEWPDRSVALIPTRALVGFGVLPSAVDLIAENGPRTSPEAGVTEAYGEYLVNVGVCHDCHGPELAGNTDPNAPQGPNITPGGLFAAYDEAAFLQLMRTGETTGGRVVSGEEMPWFEYQHMTDDELKAVFIYLKSLEPLPNAGT